MRHMPWFTLAALVVVAISPLGQDVIHSSFFSGEQLARSIGQFMFVTGLAIAVALALVEWTIRYYLRKRRSKQVAGG
jgi:hypothetical protein